MSRLVPLMVVLPLAVAALLAATSRWLPRRTPDLAAILASVAVTVVGVALVLHTHERPMTYWFGGWRPVHGMPLGVGFLVDPMSAGLAAFAALLTSASLVFSWRYFEEVGHLYHSLILVFLAGMVGFSLSADLFNLFIWLEVMSVAAYALCGYQVHQASVVQGAVNFAIINSLGTFAMLMGVTLVYAETGALNLADISHRLADAGAGPAAVVGFSLVSVGLLVKAGAVPFHFWMSDAYAVAPAPVAALFAGVMSDLAYHAQARVYWDGFAEALGGHDATAVRDVLLTVAVVTALGGAAMCVMQSDLKRQVAFLTVSHGGLFLAGIALLTPRGLAGSTLYLLTDGALKAALLLAIAVVIRQLGAHDELTLHGRGRHRTHLLTGVVFCTAGLGLAALPPFGTFLSSALVIDSPGYSWLPPVLALAAAVTSATVLRSGGRIFLGWGGVRDPLLMAGQEREPDEGEPSGGDELSRGRRGVLLAPALFLVAAAFALSFVPGVAGETVAAAASSQDSAAREAFVLHGRVPPPPEVHAYRPSPSAWGYGTAAGTGAVLLAGANLWWSRRARALARPVGGGVRGLRAVHDGSVGDYAVWFTAGAGLITLAWALGLP